MHQKRGRAAAGFTQRTERPLSTLSAGFYPIKCHAASPPSSRRSVSACNTRAEDGWVHTKAPDACHIVVIVIKFDRVTTSLQRVVSRHGLAGNNDSIKRVIRIKWLHDAAQQEVFILLSNTRLKSLCGICTTEIDGCGLLFRLLLV